MFLSIDTVNDDKNIMLTGKWLSLFGTINYISIVCRLVQIKTTKVTELPQNIMIVPKFWSYIY